MQYHPIPATSFPPEFVPGRDFYISAEQAAAGLSLHAAGPKNEHILTCAGTSGAPPCLLCCSVLRRDTPFFVYLYHVACLACGRHTVLWHHWKFPASGMFVRLQESCIAQMAPFVLAVLRAHVAGTLEGGFDGRYSAGPLDLTAFLASPANAAAVDKAVAARQARVSTGGRGAGAAQRSPAVCAAGAAALPSTPAVNEFQHVAAPHPRHPMRLKVTACVP